MSEILSPLYKTLATALLQQRSAFAGTDYRAQHLSIVALQALLATADEEVMRTGNLQEHVPAKPPCRSTGLPCTTIQGQAPRPKCHAPKARGNTR